MKITLTGSVGHISRPLARQLVARGHRFTQYVIYKTSKQAIEELPIKG